MPHNFRITGTRYVSKALVANDSNAGTDPNLPKKTIAGGLSGLAAGSTLVVGTGVYKESVSVASGQLSGVTIQGDGTVVFLGNGANSFVITGISHIQQILRNLIFKNYAEVNIGITAHTGYTLENCIFLCVNNLINNAPTANTIVNRIISGCIFTESVNTSAGTGTYTGSAIRNSIFLKDVNFNANFTPALIGNYFAANLLLVGFISSNITGSNNIRGTIRFQAAGIQYAVQDGRAGTPQDHGYGVGVVWATGAAITAEIGTTRGTAAQWDAVIATCINREPLFNNPEKLDFTLKPNSPHIGRGTTAWSSNIGGTNVAVSYLVTSLTNMRSNSLPAPVDVALESDANLQLAGLSDIDIASGTSGKIKTGWFRVNSTNKQVRTLRYIGNLNFNVDTVAPNSENENVPAVALYGSGTAGENPERLTISMQWHTGSDMPVGDTGNNGGLAPVGTFQPFLINQIPTLDTGGKTNGAPDHNPATASGINAVWVRFEVTLNNNFA